MLDTYRGLRDQADAAYLDWERPERPRIGIAVDTSSLAAGAERTLRALERAIEERSAAVDLGRVAGYGLQWLQPLADITWPDGTRVLYGPVTPDDVGLLLDEAGGRVGAAAALAIGSLAGHRPGIPAIEEHPFLAAESERRLLRRIGRTDPEALDHYIATDGYYALARMLDRHHGDEAIRQLMIDAELLGRGGAAFPAGVKWNFLAGAPVEERYLVCNADEGDPGAWVNRVLLEGDPHLILEGMLIAAYATGAQHGFIYIRSEYPLAIERVRQAIGQADAAGLLGDNILGSGFSCTLEVIAGAGAYVCGEETGLISSIQDDRGMPRIKPPFPVAVVMRRLLLATIPCVVAGILNAGYQANIAMATLKIEALPGWRGHVLSMLNVDYLAVSAWDNFCHGAMFFLPLLCVSFVAVVTWEQIFARARDRAPMEGALAVAVIFTLTLPPTLPLWQAALGISFGVILGREVFGGAGMNIVNPILAGRAFLYFAYPEQITAESIWTAVDGFTGATLLAVAKSDGLPAVLASNVSWFDAFLGRLPGALGETSSLACALGGIALLLGGTISWRIVSASVLGLVVATWLFNGMDSELNPMTGLPWYWHLVIGGFAFGVVFLATDPVTAPMTNAGRWIYGALIGSLSVIIRVTNPAIPEGVMFAILLANVFAPTLDHLVIRAHIKRRARYLARQSVVLGSDE